jgi:hypothetical protein
MKQKYPIIYLPTSDASHLIYRYKDDNLVFSKSMFKTAFDKPRHLYILSDEEIKEGEWFYSKISNKILQYTKTTTPIKGSNDIKVIATTDKSLTKGTNWEKADVQGHWICSNCEEWTEIKSLSCKCKPIPQIPTQLIKAYVEQEMDYVYLEVNEVCEAECNKFILNGAKSTCCRDTEMKLKLTDNNGVVWSEVEKEKMFNIEEVEEKCRLAFMAGFSVPSTKIGIEDWLKDNLK